MDINLAVKPKCWERLYKPRSENSMFYDNGNKDIFKSSLYIFYPKRWIPAAMPGKSTIYLYESETFCVCQSQTNCQLLDEAGGCCKYYKKITSIYLWIIKRKAHMHQIQYIYIVKKNFI